MIAHLPEYERKQSALDWIKGVVFGVILLSTSPLVAGAKDESGKGDKLVRQSQTSSSDDPLESPA